MPIEVKRVTEYRNIGGALYKTYAETTAEQVLYTPQGGQQTTAKAVLDTVKDYTGATAQAPGVHGFVPSATSAQKDFYLKGDGTWSAVDTITNSQIDTLFA